MRPTHWLWLFLLAVAADLLSIYFQWDDIRFISKPLIVLSLLAYFFAAAGNRGGFFKAALLFSLVGDVALLFEGRDPLFFMIGLGSFLLAHIFYIIAFRKMGKVAPRWLWIIAVGIYLVTLLYVLFPYLGELKVPVLIYAFVLCGMLLAVVHAFRNLYAKPGIICLAGALMFVLSDSLLAINKFYFGFTLSGLAIMFTYACAQYLLVTGAARAINYTFANR